MTEASKIILTLTGPSGTGKSHLERALVEQHGFANIISHTTRPMRAGDVNGVNYHFVSKDGFEHLETNGAFLETVTLNGQRYGASKAEFERVFASGKPVVIVVDPDGRSQIERNAPEDCQVFSVFIDNPESVRLARLVDRFLGEFASVVSRGEPAAVPVKIAQHVERVMAATTLERAWVTQAMDWVESESDEGYDLVVSNYDEGCGAMIVEGLVGIVEDIKAFQQMPLMAALAKLGQLVPVE